jgi:hypothetical protein
MSTASAITVKKSEPRAPPARDREAGSSSTGRGGEKERRLHAAIVAPGVHPDNGDRP